MDEKISDLSLSGCGNPHKRTDTFSVPSTLYPSCFGVRLPCDVMSGDLSKNVQVVPSSHQDKQKILKNDWLIYKKYKYAILNKI